MHEEPNRRLVLMRHAEAAQVAPSDAERPLTEVGRAAARDAGAWLAEQGVVPDAVLVSSALRARETWAEASAGGGFDEDLGRVEHAVYQAEPDALLDLVRFLEDEVRTALVVGHNPTVQVLALTLDDGSTDVLLGGDFAAGALAVLEVAGDWADLGGRGARAVSFHVGRG